MEKTCKYHGFYYDYSKIDEAKGLIYLKVGKLHEIPVRLEDVSDIWTKGES